MGFQEGRFLREKPDEAHEDLFSKSVRKNEHLATPNWPNEGRRSSILLSLSLRWPNNSSSQKLFERMSAMLSFVVEPLRTFTIPEVGQL